MPKHTTPESKMKIRRVTRTAKGSFVNLNKLIDDGVVDVRVTRAKIKKYGDCLIIEAL